MTPKNRVSNKKTDRTCDEAIRLLKEINQKVDYVINMLREEELRFPYHRTFVETEQSDRQRKR